ncbi:NEAT domain-containing protein, partial [Murdochiella sp. Marseille-P8839]|nr:NEAT domain-containing protein [Murdochiella sp. Marseille-P8839]
MDNKRKGTNIQTWMSKGLSFLMALLLCVTTVFSVPTVSFAAEGEETAQTATEEQTLSSEGTSVVFKRDSEDSENQESATENEAEENEAEIKNAENTSKDSVSALQSPQPAGLADGLYKVPLKLMHAYSEGRPSMGDKAVIQTATLDVKNGKATLYMQMRGLTFMGMYGHLYNLFQWKSDGNGADPYSFKGNKEQVPVIRTGKDSNLLGELMDFPEILKLTDCDVTKPYVPVCVWVDAMDAISSGGASSYDQIRKGAGEQNAKLTPDWSKAEKLAEGTDLEAVLLQAGIKQYVHDASRDAAKYSAKSYAPYKKALDTLESLASGELKDANTLFNALQEFKANRNNLVDAKKADLKDLLDQAKELKEKDYTKESWDALQKAVKDASKTFNKAMANEAEIQNAEKALKDAIAALQKTQPAGLADGLYKVPLKLMHAYSEGRPSMGDKAVIQTATLDVKNGKATLYMQMRGLTFMGMYGHLYNLFQWKSDGNGADPNSFKGNKEQVPVIRTGKDSNLLGELMDFPEILKLTDCDVTKPYVPVCVWVDAMDAISSGGASSYDQIRKGAGEQNAKLTPDWSKAEKLAEGTDLEAVLLQTGIKQYVHDASRDAAKYSAKSYAPYKKALDTLESLASGELKDANTLFNALQEFKANRNNLVDAKKADLKDLLDQAKELKEKDYTKESWDALQKAVKDASKTFNKAMANEAEIQNAEKALKDAIAALQKTQPAGLADGLYKVPLKLMHAYSEGRPSMGDKAVIQTATLDVKNGKATLYMQMRGLTFMGMYGHLYNLFQWKSDGNGADPYSFKGNKEQVPVIRTGKDSNLLGELMDFPEILKLTDCDVTKPYVPVCVWVDAMDAISSGGASSYDQIRKGAGEQNAKLTPDWSKAEKLAAGTDLEAVLLQAGIKQYVHDASRDASKYSAKSYAPYKKALDTLESLASGELKDANTLFNALQEFKANRNNLVDAKKADLKDLLDQAKELKEKDYTKESWDALQKAVKDASKTFNKAMANEAEIQNAEKALKDAIAALQKKEDPQKAQALKKLQEQLTAIRVLKESDYTPESWKPLAMQKEAAEALLKKQDATTEELLQQVKVLKAALEGLKKATPEQKPMVDPKDQVPKVWKKNETKSFTCRIIAPMMNLKSVKVDGNELAKENYSVTEGSTIITLKESYLNSLA